MWIAFKTILYKEIQRFARIWMQTLLPPIITTSLYLLIFGTLIGSRIGQMQGVSYLQYIIPGIILMTVITNSYSNTVSSFYLSKFNRSIEELLISPTPIAIVLIGYVAGGVARGLCVGIGVFISINLFVDIELTNPLSALAFATLTSALFSLAGFINAIYANSFDDISIVPTFILMPLTYLGGMFYSIEILPEFWQGASKANPIFYMVDSFRASFLDIQSVPMLHSLTIIIGFILVLSATAFYLLSKGIRIKA